MAQRANPALKKLGLSDRDRAIIVHADDVGMCNASVAAFPELAEAGLVTCGAVMTPCPWFPSTAALARSKPGLDLGVHVTLTSEWDGYRWGPISSRDRSTGMLDAEGFFPRSCAEIQSRAEPAAIAVEMAAQMEAALRAGIAPTHADTHMGAVACAAFMGSYLELGLRYRLPVMAFRLDAAGWRAAGLDAGAAEAAARKIDEMEGEGMPFLDGMLSMPLDSSLTSTPERVQTAKALFDRVGPGITHFILHPSKDGEEIRAIAPDWACRVADYRAFLDAGLLAYARSSGLALIGYGALKSIM